MILGCDRFQIAGHGRLQQKRIMAMVRQKNEGERHLVSLMLAVAHEADRDAFGELFAAIAPRVKGFLIGGGATNDVAEDVMQEVMFKVWAKAGMYDAEKASVSTWIFTIARNARIDMIRKAKRPDFNWEDPALRPADYRSADEQVDVVLKSERLQDVILTLPHAQAEVLKLSYYSGLSHGEIAQKIKIPFGTVKSRLRLALAKLRSEMEGLK